MIEQLPAVFDFTVPGAPVAKARPRIGVRGHVYTPRTTAAHEDLIAEAAAEARGDQEAITGPVSVTVVFHVPNRRRRDVDNLLKAVLDGLNGEVWRDDSQVVHTEVWVLVNRLDPHTEITIRRMPGLPYALGTPVEPVRKKRTRRPA